MEEIKCRKCGSTNLKLLDQLLLSFPPKYLYECQDCGNYTRYSIADSMLNGPIVFPDNEDVKNIIDEIDNIINKDEELVCKNCGSDEIEWIAIKDADHNEIPKLGLQCKKCGSTNFEEKDLKAFFNKPKNTKTEEEIILQSNIYITTDCKNNVLDYKFYKNNSDIIQIHMEKDSDLIIICEYNKDMDLIKINKATFDRPLDDFKVINIQACLDILAGVYECAIKMI